MKNTRVVILGAGISGLSLAYYLCKDPKIEVTLLEKQGRCGGWLETVDVEGFSFERGPRTFSTKRSGALLELVADLGLDEQLIFSDPAASKRYLYIDGKLRSLSSIIAPLLPALLKEWSVPSFHEDESIFSFGARRFSQSVARRLLDPMTLGIYAGDIHALSIKSCFPLLKTWEEERGSVTRGYLGRAKTGKDSLFSFKEGASMLVQRLKASLEGALHLGQEAKRLCFYPDRIEVHTLDRRWEADYLFSTLPASKSASLFGPHDGELASMLSCIENRTIHVGCFGFDEPVLRRKGFGYLVPTSENEPILGAVFDSCIFPQGEKTRLSVMIRGEEENPLKAAQRALKNHLGIQQEPKVQAIWTAHHAIPQYLVGHGALVQKIEGRMKALFPRCHLLGNYLRGVSVNDCVALAKSCT